MEFRNLLVKYQQEISTLNLSTHQRKVLTELEKCRTSALGGHFYVCESCGEKMVLYNSCRNRNCPVCQGNKRKQWVEKQSMNLLNIPYSHIIFTVPDSLNGLFLKEHRILNTILFQSSWQTLKIFFKDNRFLGANGGATSILHTWGQTMSLHPHVHCIVPLAGLDDSGNFVVNRKKTKYVFPVKALSVVFRAKFAAQLTALEKEGRIKISANVRKLMFHKKWVVFSSPSSQKAQTIVNYLGRYTYRTAIAQSRIIGVENNEVAFRYKNYKTKNYNQIMKLPVKEFLRRYAMHIFPYRFVRIRHYGVMNNRNKKKFTEIGIKAVGLSTKIGQTTNLEEQPEFDELEKTNKAKIRIICPKCKKGFLRELCPVPIFDIKRNLVIVEIETGEIVYQIRAGPINSEDFVLEY